MRRFSRSPEWLQLPNGTMIDHTHRSARAFSVLQEHCVISGWCTHPTLFNAIRRRLADPNFRLESYEVSTWPALTEADLEWFACNWTGVLGIMRERTLSGRVWKSIRYGDREITVVSYWVTQQDVPSPVTELVIEALALPCPVYVDYMDSTESLEWRPSTQDNRQTKTDSV